MKFYKIFQITNKAVDEAKATLEAVFSTSDEDRHGDIVDQNWDLKSFKKNPVILNSHNYDDALEVIGKAVNVKVVDGKLEGKIEFAVAQNPKAKIIFDLYAGGFLNAFSVGFIPKEFDDKNRILKSELLEISAVSVPANAYALAKSKGINVEKLYESDNISNPEDEENNGQGDPGDGNGGEADGGAGESNNLGNKGGKGANDLKNKEFENWDDGDTEIRLKVRDIAEFTAGTFKRTTVKTDIPRIEAIVGILEQSGKPAIQMLFFPKADGWTMDDAKKWFTVNQFESLGYEIGGNANDTTDSKSINKEAVRLLKDALTNIAGKKSDKSKLLNKILLATQALGEKNQVDTRSQTDRAKDKRKINQAIRNLFKEKNKI